MKKPLRQPDQTNPAKEDHPTTDLTIGARIASARDQAGWTQTKLAKAVGVSRGAVSQWEADRTEPSAPNCRKIASLLKVDSDWLSTGRGPSPVSDGENPPAGRLTIQVHFRIQLDENTTLTQASQKIKEIKAAVEAQGAVVTGFVRIGDQAIKL